MRAATRWLCAGLALLAPIMLARPAAAADFVVVPVKISLPVQMVVVGFEIDEVVKATLKEKDLINLALGRPLGSKVDKATEVLALATTLQSGPPLARLIVFNPSPGVSTPVTATVAQATTLDLEVASVKGGVQGQGTVTAVIEETVLGDAVHNALHATTVLGTGSGKSSPLPPGSDFKLSVQGVVAGRLSFTRTTGGQTTTVTGFVVNGKAKASGKAIGTFSK